MFRTTGFYQDFCKVKNKRSGLAGKTKNLNTLNCDKRKVNYVI